MTDPFYVTRSTVRKVQGLERSAELFDGTALAFGVHGPVREHYRLEGGEDLPLPVDYVAAAAGG